MSDVHGRRRALFLSTSLPPQADSQTIRSSYLLSARAADEWDWTFLTPGAGPSDGTDAEWPPAHATVRTPMPPLQRVRDTVRRFPLGRWFAWVIDNIIYRLGLPDAYAGWDRQAIAEARRLHSAKPYEVIVSASGSATAHMAAATLSRDFGIPWVADYGDPWHLVDRGHRPYVAWWSARREPAVITLASAVVFTTVETRNAYVEWLGDKMPTSLVLPYGYRRADVERTVTHAPSEETLEFSHVGAAHTANRNLVPLIDAVASVATEEGFPPLGVAIVGNHSRAFETAAFAHGTGVRWTFRDRVPYSESLEWMARASVLVIVGNTEALQVPGKVFMCLGSARPVLYLAQRPLDDDPAVDLLSKHDGVVCVPNQVDAIAAAVRRIAQNYDSMLAAARGRADSPAIAEFEATKLGTSFHAVLLEAARARGT